MYYKKLIASSLTLICLIFVNNALASGQVNVYSARKEALIKPVLDTFSQATGVTVNLITGKADALLTRLRLEGTASPADVFITVDAGRLHRAKKSGVLQKTESVLLNRLIPANLRDTDGHWFGLSQRARPIFYKEGKVDPKELSTYENLADKKWQGRICMRSSNSVYNQSLVASMLDATGKENTQQWLKQFVSNFKRKPVGGDTDQLKAVASGLCDITIANTYYYGRLINSNDIENQAIAKKLKIFWPNQQDRGTHVNVSGAGITAHSKNRDNALKLIEFLASDDSQAWYSAVNNEYPVVQDAKISPTLESWGSFKQDTVDLSKLGKNNRAAVELMDYANWK
jgi:iron(III) transport system substrate-binding protein